MTDTSTHHINVIGRVLIALPWPSRSIGQDAAELLAALATERDALRAEAVALRQAVERVRVNALEEAAQIADTISDEQDELAIETTDDHAACAHRQAEEVCWRIAAAIRARSNF
jgi:hypothetical protein